MKTAVILAAGLGSRIKGIINEIPKGFIKIGQETLIHRSLRILKSFGISNIIIATGYKSEFYDELSSRYNIVCVKNEKYFCTGSFYSLKNSSKYINDDFLQNEKFKNLIFKSSNKVSEFVSIQEGCDKFCTFCVVPYTRGAEYSRSVDSILNEVKNYIKNGIKEIILLGQNVNAYHGLKSNGKQSDLVYLINKISEYDDIKRIRYMTSHPIDMSNSLLRCHGENNKLMPFLHLPIQSGSNKILKKMNRKHTVEKYYEIVAQIKEYKPDIALSSDFIVGFPGETSKDFDQTMEFIEKIKFVIAYSFMYSPRPGTPAAKYNQIEFKEKKARLSALQSLLKQQQNSYNHSFINKELKILFDKKGRHANQYIGRSIYNQSVFAESQNNLIGLIKNIKIKRSTNFSLEGEIYE